MKQEVIVYTEQHRIRAAGYNLILTEPKICNLFFQRQNQALYRTQERTVCFIQTEAVLCFIMQVYTKKLLLD